MWKDTASTKHETWASERDFTVTFLGEAVTVRFMEGVRAKSKNFVNGESIEEQFFISNLTLCIFRVLFRISNVNSMRYLLKSRVYEIFSVIVSYFSRLSSVVLFCIWIITSIIDDWIQLKDFFIFSRFSLYANFTWPSVLKCHKVTFI